MKKSILKKVQLIIYVTLLFANIVNAQCPNPIVCSSGMNGDIVSIKLGGVGGTKTSATFGYDAGITLNALGATPNLVFQTQGTTRMTILGSNGNVGIGCSAPTVKLAVNGKIQATEVEIKTAPCSDFVFEKNYKLMSLSDLEKYVTFNKHLPEVPSAKEFAANGYSIGQMDDVLLRKVEELTLYIISMEKKLEQQQKEIQILKSAFKE